VAEPDYGTVIVTNPVDPREDWYFAAPSLRTFLERFDKRQGQSYWEYDS
jgi:hypothetical protein